MTSRFADSFLFMAMLDRRDQHHHAVAGHLAQHDDFLVTTRWVLAEVANALGSTSLREVAASWLQFVERDSNTIIVGPSDDLYRRGLDLFVKRPDKQWSLTDCISFVVMEEHGISEALTGDRHFEQAGFKAVFAL